MAPGLRLASWAPLFVKKTQNERQKMKSLIVHYMNKYPGGRVSASEAGLDVFNAENEHCVSLIKNGAGALVDRSEELGCVHRHDLSPIPKDARIKKVLKIRGGDGQEREVIGNDEKAEERKGKVEKFMCKESFKVKSCSELEAEGKFKFDAKQAEVA